MPAIASLFLALSLILAVVIGPQARPWTWGPSMLAMAVAMAAAIPSIWSRRKSTWDLGLLVYALVAAGWFAWRAWVSPVVELGQADLLLLASCVSAFVVMRAIEGHAVAEKILTWSIALLLVANVVVAFMQVADPSFTPVFRTRPAPFPSGFYGHYNEAANFLIATAMWVGAAAIFGRQAKWSRIVFGLIALGGLAAVYYTRSRGGIFGAAVGVGVFAMAALMVGKRRGAKWFAPLLIALPVMAIGLGFFLYSGWAGRQEIQASAGGTMANIFDNQSRLFFLGAAVSCISLHPFAGGGARSFSWESFRFFEGTQQGNALTHLPEQVHNELVQAATDYGLIGAGLMCGLLGALVVMAIVRTLFGEEKTTTPADDAWRIGGLAALAGMFVQSCFSYVFHYHPGALLLGICLGQLARTVNLPDAKSRGTGARLLLSAVAAGGLVLLVPSGWKGTQVLATLWPTWFSKQPVTDPAARTDALEKALRIWPLATLHKDRALVFQEIAAKGGAGAAEAARNAVADYTEARRLHPYNPDFPVNLGNLWDALTDDPKAEEAYGRATALQGGMEPAFRAHFLFAMHLFGKSSRLFDPADPRKSLPVIEQSAAEMDAAFRKMPYGINEFNDCVSVYEALGFVRDRCGDKTGALQAYQRAAGLFGGNRAYYRIGDLYRRMGEEIRLQGKPAEALGYFLEARRLIASTAELPSGATPENRATTIAGLDKDIANLQQAGHQPVPVK